MAAPPLAARRRPVGQYYYVHNICVSVTHAHAHTCMHLNIHTHMYTYNVTIDKYIVCECVYVPCTTVYV